MCERCEALQGLRVSSPSRQRGHGHRRDSAGRVPVFRCGSGLFRDGTLLEREVEMDVDESVPQMEVLSMPGMEQVGGQFKDMFSKMFPARKKRRKMKALRLEL